MKWSRRSVVLLVVGLLQMTGEVLGSRGLKGFGLATAASPAPRVFSSIRGFETYSTTFFVEWDGPDGEHTLQLTPEVYARISGPYNRRNAYGAALAAGPVLATDPVTAPMFGAVLAHALCGDAAVLRELGLGPNHGNVRIRYAPLSGTVVNDALPRVIVPACS